MSDQLYEGFPMDDFLYRLFRLTRSTRRLPREDFVSLCLGWALERDEELALHLVGCIADRAPAWRSELRSWTRSSPRLRCRPQVPAWNGDAGVPVRADLVLDLGDGGLQIVIEAKVGDAVPGEEQLDRYRSAFEGALVIPLVEERVRSSCEGPALSWDDVLQGLCTTPCSGPVAERRHDLQRLLAEADVGDVRLCLDEGAWGRARKLLSRAPSPPGGGSRCSI